VVVRIEIDFRIVVVVRIVVVRIEVVRIEVVRIEVVCIEVVRIEAERIEAERIEVERIEVAFQIVVASDMNIVVKSYRKYCNVGCCNSAY